MIQLARVYVCVKRVFLNRGSYATGSKDETPKYHERNVVAFPENHELYRLVLGQTPKVLAQFLTVQFVGHNRNQLRHEPALQVSVVRLRAAFAWLAYNCWPWMVATKDQKITGAGDLGEQLEKLLAEYEASTGSTKGASPQKSFRLPPASLTHTHRSSRLGPLMQWHKMRRKTQSPQRNQQILLRLPTSPPR